MQNGNKPTKNHSFEVLDRLDYENILDYGHLTSVQENQT